MIFINPIAFYFMTVVPRNTFAIDNNKSSGDRVTAELIERLYQAVTPTDVVAAIKALADSRAAAAIALLIQGLSHHNASVSAAAIAGLVQLAPDSGGQKLNVLHSIENRYIWVGAQGLAPLQD